MNIKVLTAAGEVIYAQKLEDSSKLNALISAVMTVPIGSAFKAVYSNNGHDFSYDTSADPTSLLLRIANGIAIRKARPAAPEATA